MVEIDSETPNIRQRLAGLALGTAIILGSRFAHPAIEMLVRSAAGAITMILAGLLLKPDGVSDRRRGWLLLAILVCGFIGAIPPGRS